MLAPGDEITLEVTLIGVAIVQADLVFAALAAAAAAGIGSDRVPLYFACRQTTEIDLATTMPDRLRLTFMTPLRLVAHGTLVTAATFQPRHFLGALVRRTSLLSHYHQAGALDLDFQDLRDRAEAASFAAVNVVWQDWARRSARQGAVIRMGGLMGTAELAMAGLEPFWPLLRLAPLLHVGKGATMGLGAVELGSLD